MSQEVVTKKVDKQNIHETTDFEELRFIGLDLDYYKKRVSPEQLCLLMEIVGIYSAPEDFNPEETFYPEDL